MIRYAPLASIMLMSVALAACSRARAPAPDSGVRTESPTLVRTLREALAQTLPDRSPETIDTALAAMREQYHESLLTTELEEAAMQSGRFDDHGNRDDLAKLLDHAQRHEVPILTVVRTMLADLEAGKLRGARLELTTRLLATQLKAAAVQSLQDAF